MDFLFGGISSITKGVLSVFAGRHPMFTLVPISVLAGVVMLWAFGRFSNQAALRSTKKRLKASLYELRLFADDPGLIFRAQKELLIGNLRYMALMLRPAVILTVPMVLLFVQMESFYGLSPLPVGGNGIVTARMTGGWDMSAPAPRLVPPDGIAVETPAVRVLRDRTLVWRVRASREVSGQLRLAFAGGQIEKSIDSGAGPRYVSGRRVSSNASLFWHPAEPRITGAPVEWVEVGYPGSEIEWFGVRLHWLIWFILISLVGALLFKGRMKVTF
ncbi:MAG TPA: hypothetical protein VLE22_16715 [Bryobacteraceae bacterium]|nr:hypothetical protein [Bryobacteraceae bacterium]